MVRARTKPSMPSTSVRKSTDPDGPHESGRMMQNEGPSGFACEGGACPPNLTPTER